MVADARWRVRRPDGAEVLAIGSARPVRAPDGTRIGAVLTLRDDTARASAEAALRELNETLESQVAERTAERDRMWRLSTDIMLVARFDAAVTAVNPAWTTLLGWREDELLGRSFMDLVHPDDAAPTAAEAGKLAEGVTTWRFENRYRHRDGGYRWISWTAVPGDGLIHARVQHDRPRRRPPVLAAARQPHRQPGRRTGERQEAAAGQPPPAIRTVHQCCLVDI